MIIDVEPCAFVKEDCVNTVETEKKGKQCGDRGLGPESLWML